MVKGIQLFLGMALLGNIVHHALNTWAPWWDTFILVAINAGFAASIYLFSKLPTKFKDYFRRGQR